MNYCSNYFINISHLKSNIKKLVRHAGRSVKFCAVVKADCYGLGFENVIPYIDDLVDMYAVANLGECKALRVYTQKEILMLGGVEIEDAHYYATNNIGVSVNSLNELKALEKALVNDKINIHIAYNTGMNRYGIKSELLLKKCVALIKKSSVLNLEGIYTHFATDDKNSEFLFKQYDKFNKIALKNKSSNCIFHCSASFASLNYKQLNKDMVRVGFAMYGFINNNIGLQKVVNITSKVIEIQNVKRGEGVGYDLTYVANKNMRIAVVGFGYADGYARNLGNMAYVLINGVKAKVIGRVCMDCFMVDITNIKNVYVGTGVMLLGRDGNNEITLQNYAEWLNTSPYEVLLNFRRTRTNVVLNK